MMSVHHQTENLLGNRPINDALHPSIYRSIDRSINRVRLGKQLTLQVFLGLQCSCESSLARRETFSWLDLIKAFHIAELSTMFPRLWIVFHQGMEWNGFSHNHPAFALILSCYLATKTRQDGLVHLTFYSTTSAVNLWLFARMLCPVSFWVTKVCETAVPSMELFHCNTIHQQI